MKTARSIHSARILIVGLSALVPRLTEGALPVCEIIAEIEAAGVSGDGKVVVGRLQAEPKNPVRWTTETGIIGLQTYPKSGAALAVSGDGSVIVGWEGGVNLGGVYYSPRAFRWTAPSGIVLLPYLPYGSNTCIATAVSKNGLVAVGWGDGPAPWIGTSRPSRAVRWDLNGPAQQLGDLDGDPNTFTSSSAGACSYGGQYIYGTAQSAGANWNYPGFQWFEAGASMASLGLPAGYTEMQINCCDDRGSNFAGALSGPNQVACYGLAFVGIRILGDLPGGAYASLAKAMSGDGLFVGGFGTVAHPSSQYQKQAFVWSPVYEMENLNLLLFSLGMPQFLGANPEVVLTEVVGISDSTDVIVCNGFNRASGNYSAILISGLRDFLSGSAPFQINSFYRVAENRIQLSWPCRPGKSYQIQESENLKDWNNVGDPVIGESFSILREVNFAGGNARYWRVAVLEN